MKILVAGVGNIFLGDDAFGVEVARALSGRPLPEGVTVKDFGIRGFDLAYTMLDAWDTVILVDALSRGEAPGTLYLLEPDLAYTDKCGDHPQPSWNGSGAGVASRGLTGSHQRAGVRPGLRAPGLWR